MRPPAPLVLLLAFALLATGILAEGSAGAVLEDDLLDAPVDRPVPYDPPPLFGPPDLHEPQAPLDPSTAAQPTLESLAMQPGNLGPAALLDALQNGAAPHALHNAFFAFMADQQHLDPAALDPRASVVPATAGGTGEATVTDGDDDLLKPPPPPHRVYRAHRPVCDLNQDNTTDIMAHERTLDSAPIDRIGPTTLRGVSGATGETLWTRDDLDLATFILVDVDYRRHGEPLPRPPYDAQAMMDLNGDGVCDFIGISLSIGITQTLASAAYQEFTVNVHGISGANGNDQWRWTHPGSLVIVSDPTTGVVHAMIEGYPTGFLAYDSPSGPKTVVKSTDVSFTMIQEPLLTGLYMTEIGITERLHMLNATHGGLLWERTLSPPPDDRVTDFVWIDGIADLTGDGEPEILLNHMTITTPRGSEASHPVTGENFYRYAKGMRITTIVGDPVAMGATHWTTTVRDPFAVQVDTDQEDSLEHLVWTHGRFIGDITGTGLATPVASYVAQEESLPGTASGRYRTHFVPLHPENGTVLWDVRHQGWGYMEHLGVDADSPNVVGIGMVDLPTLPPPGGQFPPKFVRIGVLDATTGGTLWTYERVFAQNSFLVYNMALGQFRNTLAPHDWTGDGLRDLVTPSQYEAPSGGNQVLLATSSHHYEVLQGRDGHTLGTFSAWGPDGRVVLCPGAEDELTVISGFGRRLDLTRFNVTTGQQTFRQPLWNNPMPVSATQGIDVLSIGITCQDLAPDRIHVSLNAQAFSGIREHEVIAVNGFFDPGQEEAGWMQPELRGNPPTTSIFEPHQAEPQTFTVVALGAGIGFGILAGGAAAGTVLLAHRHGRRMRAALAVTVALLLLTGVFFPLAQTTTATSPSDPLSDENPVVGDEPLSEPPPGSGIMMDLPTGADRDGPGDPDREGVIASRLPDPTEVAQDDDAGYGSEALDGSGPGAPHERTLADTMRTAEGLPFGPASNDGAAIPETPYLRLLHSLQEQGDSLTPEQHVRLVSEFYGRPWWRPAQYAVDPAVEYDTDGSIAFTRELGDVTGDRVDDFLLDELCIDPAVCDRPGGDAVDDALDLSAVGQPCGPPHQLKAISGVDGAAVWNKSLDHNTPTGACKVSFVVDVVPIAPGQNGVLVYTIEVRVIGLNWYQRIEHTYEMLNATTGETIWQYQQTGVYVFAFAMGSSAVDQLLNPILQVPPEGGVRAVRSDEAEPSLHLQGVGHQTYTVSSVTTAPGIQGPVHFLDTYKPTEWVARIDLRSGEELWKAETFVPDPRRSVLPELLTQPSFDGMANEVLPGTDRHYWGHEPCCYDLTGDGVPDLVYRTYEWTDTPLYRPDGPHDMDSRVLARSGQDGSLLYDPFVVMDAQVPYTLRVQAVGDTTGDGHHDILLHLMWSEAEWGHDMSLLRGKDGTEAWASSGVRTMRAYAMGDATGNGGNDLLLVDWYGYKLTENYVKDAHRIQRLPLSLVVGETGTTLWQTHTYAAPADYVFMMDLKHRTGFPDYTGDGVADLFIDDPLFLGDLTVVHRQTLIAGRDARPIYTVETAGAFSLPFRVADVTGDGTDDLAFLSGDLNDLWLTVYESQSAQPLWSTRILSLPVSNYASAYPNLQVHAITRTDGPGMDFLVNFHLQLFSVAYTVYVPSSGRPGDSVFTTNTNTPQLLRFQGLTGTLGWSYPVQDESALGLVDGASPATVHWMEASAPPRFDYQEETHGYLAGSYPALLSFAGSFAGVLAFGAFSTRARRIREEVPDLEDL